MVAVGFVAMGMVSLAQAPVEEDIRGAKPVVVIPEPEAGPPWMTYGWIGGMVLLVVVAGVAWFVLRGGKVTSEEVMAGRELDVLARAGKDLEAGEFALQASNVVRTYIERRFGLAARRRTTEEFFDELLKGGNPAMQSRMDALKGFLRSCDLAKFAGVNLDQGDRGELLVRARTFVMAGAEQGKEEAR